MHFYLQNNTFNGAIWIKTSREQNVLANQRQREQETFTNKNMFGIVHGFIFLQNLSLISFPFYK